MNKGRIAIVFFLLASTFAAFILYFHTQPVVNYTDCLLCDGSHYLRMYDSLKGNMDNYQEEFPYYSRVLVPWLAALLPWSDALWSFQFINLTFSLLSVAAIYYLWVKLEIPFYLVFIGIFWLVFHWTGIIRLNAFDPYTVDVPIYFLQTIFILIFLTKRFRLLWILGPVAVLQKESIIVLLLVFIIFSYVNNKFQDESDSIPMNIIIIALVLSIAAKYLFTLKFPPVETDKSSVRTVLFYIREAVVDPFKIVRWVVGIFMAFGALFLLALQKFKKESILSPQMSFITIMSLTYLCLGLVGGADNTRIVFLGFPFIMTWVLLVLKDVSWKLNIIALLLSVFIMKLLGTIPDPNKDFYTFASWYPEFAESGVVLLWGVYFMFCFLFLFLIDRLIKVK